MSVTDTIKQAFECWGWMAVPTTLGTIQTDHPLRVTECPILLLRVGVNRFSIGVRGSCGWMAAPIAKLPCQFGQSIATRRSPNKISLNPSGDAISVLPCSRGLGGVA
jgi:hypothetical protein